MRVVIAVIQADLRNPYVLVAQSDEGLRCRLLAYHNDAVRDGGLGADAIFLPDDAPVELIAETIAGQIGKEVFFDHDWLTP